MQLVPLHPGVLQLFSFRDVPNLYESPQLKVGLYKFNAALNLF
jgi:hypothetical protein